VNFIREENNMAFYEFDQNNSGGSFDVNEKLCHRLVIEADTYQEAENIAENFGVYFDGCDKGIDCSCCGDRWYSGNLIDLEKYKERGYEVSIFDHYASPEQKWFDKYGKYEVIKQPKWDDGFAFRHFTGKIYFRNVEEYMQFLADEYGWTTPDARIFYKNGTVKEIFKNKS
jgi:hypothetical protein